uniref:Uncharacterized protein n=1 Tax=viral metagenome TaxID=1070528 RepID=A0A6M3J876_9ZZZZ
MVNKVGLFVIGIGIGVFLTIVRTTWGESEIVVNVALISVVICAAFVAILTLSKKNQC